MNGLVRSRAKVCAGFLWSAGVFCGVSGLSKSGRALGCDENVGSMRPPYLPGCAEFIGVRCGRTRPDVPYLSTALGKSNDGVGSAWPRRSLATCSGASRRRLPRTPVHRNGDACSGPRDGYTMDFRHPSCFARALSGCSRKLTREHFYSASVLECLNKQKVMTVTGFPWQRPGEELPLPPSALAGRILCEAHNMRLSPIDAEGAKFFRFFEHVDCHMQSASSAENIQAIIDGDAFERWLLKSLDTGRFDLLLTKR